MTIQKHTHKLKRHKYTTGNEVFFCILPDCTFKIDVPFAVGKRTVCHRCNGEFLLDENTVRLKRPHCNDCAKVRVIDPVTGKKLLVSKNDGKVGNKANVVLQELAHDTTTDLRNRLAKVIQESLESTEDDLI